MSDEFNWHNDHDDVIVPPNEGVAVYLNPRGNIVIRAKADGHLFDDDPFVVVPIESVGKLIERLKILAQSQSK